MKSVHIIIVLLMSTLCGYSDDEGDPLKLLLSKSDLVVSGEITSEPLGVTWSSGFVHYICDYKVERVFKGNAALKGKTIKVNIIRREVHAKDRHPLVSKGCESILFLKGVKSGIPAWLTFDHWFGVQRLSPSLARSLKQREQK